MHLRILLLAGLLSVSAFPGAAAPGADVAEIVATLHRERDKADPMLIQQLAEDGTRAGAEGLVSVYDSMSSIGMRLDVLLGLALYDGVPEAEQITLQKIANIATTSEEPELHELAVDLLGESSSIGKHFLKLIVDSPAESTIRERAMLRHTELFEEADIPWYEELFYQPEREAKEKKKKPKQDELIKKVNSLTAIREMAFEKIAMHMKTSELADLARDKEKDRLDIRKDGIRRIALLELERRGDKKAKTVAEKAYKDTGEKPTNRVYAARILAKLEGDKMAARFVEDGMRDKSVIPLELRVALADLVAEMNHASSQKKMIKELPKAKPHELLFLLPALRTAEDEKLDELIVELLEHESPRVRISAVKAIAARGQVAALPELAELIETEEDASVTAALIDAMSLLRTDDPAWPGELAAFAVHEKFNVRNAAIAELTRRDPAAHVELLTAALNHEDWSTRTAALAALEAARTPEATGVIVARMEQETGFMRHRFADALWRLTGQPFRTNPRSWQSWWEKEKDVFSPISAEALAELEAEEEKRRLTQTTKASSFFGIRILSHRVLFILDVSGSMDWEMQAEYEGVPGETRISVARRELVKCLDSLEAQALFNIIVFSSDVERWLDGGIAEWNDETKEEAIAFVERLSAGGATNIYAALREAFKDPDVDTIFVLSDGEPAGGDEDDPYVIREHVQEWNEHRGIVINTIAVGGDLSVLEWLAEDSGGSYVKYD